MYDVLQVQGLLMKTNNQLRGTKGIKNVNSETMMIIIILIGKGFLAELEKKNVDDDVKFVLQKYKPLLCFLFLKVIWNI